MINISELDAELNNINGTNDSKLYSKFKESLLSSNDKKILEYHYNLFSKDTDEVLKETIVYSFAERKGYGEEFLLEQLKNETNIFFQALSIELLGMMKYKKALEIIRTSLKHKSEFIRQRACIALGYIGSSKDIKDLGYIQLNDSDVVSRELSPITQMRISNRYKKAKEKLLDNFLQALQFERKLSVILAIGYATQYIVEKDFHILEVNEGEFTCEKEIEELRKELKQTIEETLGS
jgi:hypothetical protein